MPASDKARAFTLIELLIVIAVIALLMAIAFPIWGMFQRAAERTETRAHLAKIAGAIEKYRVDYGSAPLFTGTWTNGSEAMVIANNTRLYTMLCTTESDARGRPWPGYLTGDSSLPSGRLDPQARLILDRWGKPVIYMASAVRSATIATPNYGWPAGVRVYDEHKFLYELWSMGRDEAFQRVRGSAAAATASTLAQGVDPTDMDNIAAASYNPADSNQKD